jgi:hypothetical protein
MAVFCLAGASFQFIPDEPAGEPQAQLAHVQETTPEQSYIGTDKCITCHRKQADIWSETKHANAFDHLPPKYREDASCLKCHLTGLDEPGGYVVGMTAEAAQPFLSVGCESCHGPGAVHAAGVQRWMTADPAEEEKLLKEMRAAIVKTPPDSQCAVCHQNQTHRSHPAYEGQPVRSSSFHGSSLETTSSAISPPPSPNSYSVKTCGSCHYEQYKTWLIDKHVGLSTGLPAKYENDESCLKCHRKSGEPSDWFTAETDPQTDAIPLGVGCESCHGSAVKHVLFNKQFISGPQLTPEIREATRELMRQEQLASACLQCHVRDGHQEHPKYENPDAANTK